MQAIDHKSEVHSPLWRSMVRCLNLQGVLRKQYGASIADYWIFCAKNRLSSLG